MKKPIWSHDWCTMHFDMWSHFLRKFTGKESHALEIGAYEGRSTAFFANEILTHPKSTITCVDSFSIGSEKRFWHNMDATGCRKKVKLVKGLSDNVNLAMKPWDVIYIDGSHESPNVMKDAVRSWVSLKKGGVMIFDDLHLDLNTKTNLLRPKMAADMFCMLFEREIKILCLCHQLIIEKTV